MSKRPPARDAEDDGEPEAKRLRLALAQRASELQQNHAPFGLYQELLPELKLLIAYKMPLRDLIGWLQTEKALAEPKFLVLFWQTLVKMDYRSPLTGELHRFVVTAEAHFDKYCQLKGLVPSTPAWFDVSVKFWRATFFNASVLIRYVLYMFAQPQAYEVRQTDNAFVDLVSVPGAHISSAIGRPFSRGGPAPKERNDTIARNNWLALAESSERRRASRLEAGVFFTETTLDWTSDGPPLGTAFGGRFIQHGLTLRLRLHEALELLEHDDNYDDYVARMMPTTDALLLHGEPLPDSDLVVFKWEQRPLIRGRVEAYIDSHWYTQLVCYTLEVDAVDIDAMLDWATAHVMDSRSDGAYLVVGDFFRRFDPHEERWKNLSKITVDAVRRTGIGWLYLRLLKRPFSRWLVETCLLRVALADERPPTYFSDCAQ